MPEMEISLKILIACVFGGLVGYSREKEKKAAGLRTHILVCLGSCLFTVISLHFGTVYPGSDAARIAANIVVGIGFIGAGTIIRDSSTGIIGITTAASVWIISAIGMAIGAGMYFSASTATLATIIVLYFLHGIEKKYIRGEKE